MRRIFVLVLSVLTVLVAEDADVRAETAGNDFGWSSEVDAALVLFENGDVETAVQRLTPLADAGDADAQYLLGLLYQGELGIEEDFCRSLQRHEEAAAQEHVAAIASVGALHLMGRCTQEDNDAAAGYFLRAAKLGDGEAAFMLSLFHMDSEPNSPDPKKAMEWLERAWKLKQQSKFRNSRLYIPELFAGSFYKTGYGVQVDLEKSERYFWSSASQGSPLGQLYLGQLYLDQPTHPRHLEAWKWIILSASQGHEPAANLIEDAGAKLKDDERHSARDAARELFDQMVSDPRLELGRAAKWCFEHEPESNECLRRAYDQHYRCSPGINPTYFETRYVNSLAYRRCRKAAFDAQSMASDG